MATAHHRAEPRGHFDQDGLPWLENGERMDQATFHARYLETPPGFKAELIGGIVYVMASPVGSLHGERDSDAIAWLVNYRARTPGTAVVNNTTAILGGGSEPQPDAAIYVRPEFGGRTTTGPAPTRILHGSPELVVEVSQTTRSIDLGSKRVDYEAAGVLEYVVVDLGGRSVHWHRLVDASYRPILPDPDGLIRSSAFPGLWLDPAALADGRIGRVFEALDLGLASPEHAGFVAELERRRAGLDRERPPG